jgi:hypothetical protein
MDNFIKLLPKIKKILLSEKMEEYCFFILNEVKPLNNSSNVRDFYLEIQQNVEKKKRKEEEEIKNKEISGIIIKDCMFLLIIYILFFI